ncbi:LysR family transcriptional regulator [Actinorhabdospora filicis]|uniref:LysR family transcriptional regulator n=1 Tax=Actinorhabdospora filicis TaxID=1785913 RepID=A0A9W6SSH1_9ACTN|nr:LysR family transcriptional regulator [Actinorhabdospora filicis]GLZ81253.1 LysR family transcriptional regulator [Actinorhabdospora filicis]
MSLPLDLLRTFLAVHRSGSATHAAGPLGLSQPAVTAQIKALETRIGRPLFTRGPRGMIPTPAADDLAARIAGPIDALEAVAEPGAPVVHIGGPAELMCERVLPALAPLVRDGLRVRAVFGLPDDLIARLTGGALDLAIATVRPRRIPAEPLFDEEFVLVGAPGHTAADIDTAPLIAYAENQPILRRYWRSVFDTRLNRPPAVVVPDLRGVLAATVAGAGITVLPRYLCLAELADGRLHALLEPAIPPLNTVFIAARPGRADPVRGHLRAAARSW